MKRFSEQLHKQSQTVKLKKSEQADLRERLISYMEYHPLPASMKAAEAKNLPTRKAPQSQMLTDTFAHFAIPYQMLFKFGSVAAVFVLVVIPFMAERTVPGDTLYAVKVQFNEEVRSSLTWGSYEKVEWETTRLNRRIAEARLLADEGLLTPEAEAEVAAAVKVHSDNAKREIEVLRTSDADEATIAEIAFDSSLSVQAQVLNQEDVDGTEATTGDLISDAIDASMAKIPQTDTPAIPAYAKLMARTEINTTRVRELRDSLEGSVSEQALADVTRRIEDIERVVVEAIDLAQNPESELEAREMLVTVLVRTQKLIVFMTELEVREQVTIESVVPVVPTESEMTIDRDSRMAELDAMIAKLTAAEEKVTNPALRLKVEDALDKLEETKAALQQTQKYAEFIAISTNAMTLGKDALKLVDIQGIALPSPVVPAVLSGTTTASSSLEVASDQATTSDTTAESDRATTSSENTQG